MSTLFDRAKLDSYLDDKAGPLGGSWWRVNPFVAAEDVQPTELLDALDAVSENDPRVLAFTGPLRSDPDAAKAFQTRFVQGGENFLTALEANIVAGTTAALDTSEVTEDTRLQSLRDAGIANPTLEAEFFESWASNNTLAEQFADAAGLTGEDAELITGNEALVNALGVARQDGTFNKNNLTQAFNGAGGGEALKNIMSDPQQAQVFINVLTKIGDGSLDASGNDITVAHLVNLSKAEGQAEQLRQLRHMGVEIPFDFSLADFFKFLAELMQNPERAVNNLVNDMVDAGFIDPEQANMYKGVGTQVASVTRFAIEPYYNLAQKHQGIIGRTIEGFEEDGQESTDRYGGPTTITEQTEIAQADANRGVAVEATGVEMASLVGTVNTEFTYRVNATAEDVMADALRVADKTTTLESSGQQFAMA